MNPLLQRPSITAADVPADWIVRARHVVHRDGHGIRGGRVLISKKDEKPEVYVYTIEGQSIRYPELWQATMLPGNGHTFVTEADRDAVMNQICRTS